MEDEIEESKLETLSNIIKRKDSRIKMLSKISRNSKLIRLNLLVSAQLDKSTSNFQMKSEEFVSDLIDLLINSVIKVEPPAPTPQATHDETPSVEEVCENFGLNDVNLNYSHADYQNFAQFVSDFEVNNDIKVEPPAPTPQATHPLVEEVCESFGLNNVNLNYSDADYQNFAQFVSDFEINNDIKFEPPPPTPKATNDESEIRSDSQINNYIKTLLLSLLKTELAEESEEKKCLPVPEMTVELDDSTPRHLTRLEIRKRLAHEKC